MAINFGFITGARSEYGIAKKLLYDLKEDNKFSLNIYVTGMHLLQTFGHTIDEIIKDRFSIKKKIQTYEENGQEKAIDFTRTISSIYSSLKNEQLDCCLVVGDRLEAYAAALACHFLGIPVVHSGGGTLTSGAVDDIYRYNITNLSQLHLATSRSSYDRLHILPTIKMDNISFVGSVAIDSILSWKVSPKKMRGVFPELEDKNFALMTFHPVTRGKEPIVELLEFSVMWCLNNNINVLITYPNNDSGYEEIVKTIKKLKKLKGVFVSENLGAENYYTSLHNCLFVIGNSSSGIIEAPYFEKIVLNIGSRQDGRDRDNNVVDVMPAINDLTKKMEWANSVGWEGMPCEKLYGEGQTVKRIKESIIKFLQ